MNTALVPMPRIVSWLKPVFWEKLRDGARPAISSTVLARARCSSAPDSTLTASGVACRSRSPVFAAVTVIFSKASTQSLSTTATDPAPASRTRAVAGANPWADAVTSYSPSGGSTNANLPSASVRANCVAAAPIMATLTPGTGVPDESSTMPVTRADG